jgi:hypothetical protein
VCQAQDQVAEFVTDWWAARLVGIVHFLAIRRRCQASSVAWVTMPMPMQVAGEQPGQSGQHRPLRPIGSRSADPAAQHGDVVAQDEDLHVLGCGAAGEQPELAEHHARD